MYVLWKQFFMLKDLIFDLNITFNGKDIGSVQEIKYLGFRITRNLN